LVNISHAIKSSFKDRRTKFDINWVW